MTFTSRLKFTTLYAAAWLPFTAAYGVLLAKNIPLHGPQAIEAGASSALLAPILGVAAWFIARRIAAYPSASVAFVVGHVATAAGYGIAWSGAIALLIVIAAGHDAVVTYAREGMAWQTLIGVLCYGVLAAFAHVYDTVQRLREREGALLRADSLRARADANRVDAELRALRARLNPHFLFNVLHSVSAIVSSDPRAAEDALERLAKLLRYVLDVDRGPDADRTLGDEFMFVRDYLSLESLRLGDRLTVVEDIDPESLDCVMPAMTLEPLVNNAIRHGISPQIDGGTIRLSSRIEDETVIVEVHDDGMGCLLPERSAHSGLGLSIVRQRLLATYGEAATLVIRSDPLSGFSAEVRYPIRASP